MSGDQNIEQSAVDRPLSTENISELQTTSHPIQTEEMGVHKHHTT